MSRGRRKPRSKSEGIVQVASGEVIHTSPKIEHEVAVHCPQQNKTTLDSFGDDEILCPAAKVSTIHATPRFASPWKSSSQWQSVGTCFPIGDRKLLTNAHVVANAHLLHVRRIDGHNKFVASVAALCFECDLALLVVEDDTFWTGFNAIEFANNWPRLQDEIVVVGFPDSPSGGDTVCITKGVVSRIDLQSYSCDSRMLAVQIDAAINSGNSGGPCVDHSGALVGVAFQKSMSASQDNVGFIIPVLVVRMFLKYAASGIWGFGAPGFRWSLLDNPSLRRWVGLSSGLSGVLVTALDPSMRSEALLEPACDVILGVDDVSVGEDGTVPLIEDTSVAAKDGIGPRRHQLGLRVSFEWLFRRRSPGDTVVLDVLGRGQRRKVMWTLGRTQQLVPSDPLDGERLGVRPEYLLVSGLVFVPLTEPYISEMYGADWTGCPARLELLWRQGRVQYPGHQIVLLSEVLACELTQGYEIHARATVERCDGQAVRNLPHLAQLVAACEAPFLRFDLSDDKIIALERDQIETSTQSVMKINQISQPQHIIYRGCSAGPLPGAVS